MAGLTGSTLLVSSSIQYVVSVLDRTNLNTVANHTAHSDQRCDDRSRPPFRRQMGPTTNFAGRSGPYGHVAICKCWTSSKLRNIRRTQRRGQHTGSEHQDHRPTLQGRNCMLLPLCCLLRTDVGPSLMDLST